MRKYLTLAKVSWESGLVYRLNFVMWRVRQILSLLTAYFLWRAVFSGREQLFGYQESQMLTYVLAAAILQAIVFATRSIDLAGIINSGDLSQLLIKPLNHFAYWFSRDMADKALNILFSIAELILLFLLLRPPLVIPNFAVLAPIVLLVVPLSTLLYFYINYFFGILGFWTPQVWAPRFLLFVVLQFVAGSLFPLDVLPMWLQRGLAWTPFPYLLYFPTQIMLGRLDGSQITQGSIALAFWTLTFYLIVRAAWSSGLKAYAAEGS